MIATQYASYVTDEMRLPLAGALWPKRPTRNNVCFKAYTSALSVTPYINKSRPASNEYSSTEKVIKDTKSSVKKTNMRLLPD